LKGEFDLEKTGDVYLDVSLYGKGYVWINGKNLGRYWNAGPQGRLFCPGVWLKKGKN
jgi:beta-galactosidase